VREATIDAASAEAEARLLLDAERNRVPIAPPTDRHAGLTLADGYAIQAAGIALRLADGAALVGRKVGLTSQAMQHMLGVDQPDCGAVFEHMVLGAGEGLEMSALIAPRVEAEIAFFFDMGLAGADVSAADVLAATSDVSAALEIIDSRIADWRITIADTIADNASSGQVILGERRPVGSVDVLAEEATVTIGERAVTGAGAAVLGDPAEAIAWLVRTLALHGEGLRPGDFVIPGAVAAALPFAAGDLVRAEYSTLGTIEVTAQ
jgi:2-keto-4-pentenoate hydratase